MNQTGLLSTWQINGAVNLILQLLLYPLTVNGRGQRPVERVKVIMMINYAEGPGLSNYVRSFFFIQICEVMRFAPDATLVGEVREALNGSIYSYYVLLVPELLQHIWYSYSKSLKRLTSTDSDACLISHTASETKRWEGLLQESVIKMESKQMNRNVFRLTLHPNDVIITNLSRTRTKSFYYLFIFWTRVLYFLFSLTF